MSDAIATVTNIQRDWDRNQRIVLRTAEALSAVGLIVEFLMPHFATPSFGWVLGGFASAAAVASAYVFSALPHAGQWNARARNRMLFRIAGCGLAGGLAGFLVGSSADMRLTPSPRPITAIEERKAGLPPATSGQVSFKGQGRKVVTYTHG